MSAKTPRATTNDPGSMSTTVPAASPAAPSSTLSHAAALPTAGSAVHRRLAVAGLVAAGLALAAISTVLVRLSERERDVAVALGQGRSNAQIGNELFMSVATVKAHVSSMLAKFDLNNRTQLALLAHDAGLTS